MMPPGLVGFPIWDAVKLGWNVQGADWRQGAQGTGAGAANGHGMGGMDGRKDKQNQCDAYSGTADYVGNADQAGALHAIEDSYVHQYAFWNGGSNPFGVPLHWPGLAHFINDLWYNDAAEAGAEAYLKNLGHSLNPGGYIAPNPTIVISVA